MHAASGIGLRLLLAPAVLGVYAVTMASNRYEFHNRALKVERMVKTARRNGVTATMILNPETGESDLSAIRMIEMDLRLQSPGSSAPSVETWAMVRETLAALERLDASYLPKVRECGCRDDEDCCACAPSSVAS